MRRSVRRPMPAATTSCMSSSGRKLPFMRASTLPARASATAEAAAAGPGLASMISHPVISIFNDAASDRISCSGPTRIGLMSPTSDARTAPSSEA